MKKILIGVLFAACMTATSALAGPYDYIASVYRAKTTTTGDVVLTEATTGITYQVLTAGSDTVATITVFGDDAATAKTNAVTTTAFATDGLMKFRSGSAATTVDLVVTDTVGGFSTIVNGFSPQDHKIVIDETAGVKHHGLVPFACSGTAVTDTGIDFNYDSMVSNVTVEAISGASAGDTIDVGLLATETSGDENGFVALWSTDITGYLAMTLTSSGALMDDGTNFNPGGHYVESANAKSLTYTCPTEAGAAIGYIHYDVTEVR